ncbi:hypothetical protein CH362_14895 [Leptospira saintgironsiae]|uniref:Uncharacterized protein n=1 Tax=Leptospira saintgironsiae TaxID=2023183 RepID=A0A2M9YAK8_9LEPT|nr:hypothetical protein CH362_14895 [Leptospira saintgironsiae]
MFCNKGREINHDAPHYPVEMPGVWKEIGVNDLRSGNTFAFSKNGTVVYIIDPAICIKKERAMIGEYLWSEDRLYIYFYKFLQLEGGDLNKIKNKCEAEIPGLKLEEKLIILNEGSMKVLGLGNFTQRKNGYDFDDLTSFKTGGSEFYKFSKYPEHFQEIVDHEIKDERRLILEKRNVYIRNNTGKEVRYSFD